MKSVVTYENPTPPFPRLPLASDQRPLLVAALERIGFPDSDIRCQVKERLTKMKQKRAKRGPKVHLYNSNIANFNMGTQSGTISASVQSNSAIVQSNPAVFDKRMEIFKCTRSLISSIVTNAHVEIHDMMKFRHETRDHQLFFGPEVETYLSEIFKNGLELSTINFVANNPSPYKPQQPDYGRQTEILHWFVQQQELAPSVFQKYVDFTKP